MAKRKSKLKQMAEAGNQWAIETLARMQAQGRAAGVRGATLQRATANSSEAMHDAQDIREWTDGPKPAAWRVYRLALALSNAG